MYSVSHKILWLLILLEIPNVIVSSSSASTVQGLVPQTASQVKAAFERLSQKDVERMRKMFEGSRKLADESMFELNTLNNLQENFNVHNTASLDNPAQTKLKGDKNFIIHEDRKNDGKQYKISTTVGNNNQPTGPLVGLLSTFAEPKDDIVVEEAEIGGKLSGNDTTRNDPRQSSLFSGFRPAVFPGTLGSGLNSNALNMIRPPSFPSLPSLPTLPTFPTLPLPTQKPPRPPKSSIIGNNGGSMALTNDNVVVVNVLSNNYK